MIHFNDRGALADVRGVAVGHAQDDVGLTGVTVVLLDGGEGRGAVASGDVRGGAPGTRETDLLDAERLVARADAFVLAGGSAFGLGAADGVVALLEERGRGFRSGPASVPIVPAAILFDLNLGDPRARPDAAMGRKAALAAGADRSRGSVGAGTGALVGKALGPDRATKGGLGQASAVLATGARVGALAVVNAFGEVRDPATGATLAGARGPDGAFVATVDALDRAGADLPWKRESTTLAIVATDAPLGKSEVAWVARMAQAGLARTICPAWTSVDGDVVFAAATGLGPRASADLIGAVAADCVARAIVDAVLSAESRGGAPAARELARG
jgi:L-aminopeptidase/D-esterase-like protein